MMTRMKRTLIALTAMALLALTGCASVSPEERATETATAYMNANLGYDTEADISSFACEGTDLRVDGDGAAGVPVVVESVSQNSDGTWAVGVRFSMTSATPLADIVVSEDGDCIVQGR